MAIRVLGLLVLASVLMTGLALALSDNDNGGQWVQAPTQQRVAVTNILSRALGGDPMKYMQCLDKIFADPKNANVSIREAAQQCKAQQ